MYTLLSNYLPDSQLSLFIVLLIAAISVISTARFSLRKKIKEPPLVALQKKFSNGEIQSQEFEQRRFVEASECSFQAVQSADTLEAEASVAHLVRAEKGSAAGFARAVILCGFRAQESCIPQDPDQGFGVQSLSQALVPLAGISPMISSRHKNSSSSRL